MAYSAVLFDMDGTLVDSDAIVEAAWHAWCERYGVDFDELIAVAHGVPSDQTARRFLPDATEAEIAEAARFANAYEYGRVDGVTPTDAAHELLAALDAAGVPWAIVTSADRRLARIRLEAAGIPVPSVVVTSEDVPVGKPDPAGYQMAAAALGVDAATTLVVEDTAPGVAAGRAAGATVAALKGQDGDVRIASLRDLMLRLFGGGSLTDMTVGTASPA
jgi:sugar-phosphatase